MRLIDADKLKEDINSKFLTSGEKRLLCRIVDKAPTVDTSDTKYLEERDADAWESGYIQGLSERPHGKWILCEDTYFSKCSICGDIWLNEECWNYCSNCGADMRSDNHGKK